MDPKKKTIAVDFDGVIHKYSQVYHDGTIYDPPVDGARHAIKLIRMKGYNVVIYTARPDLEDVARWLKEKKIIVDDVTNIKPKAMMYIDDRAVRFTNWRDMLNYL